MIADIVKQNSEKRNFNIAVIDDDLNILEFMETIFLKKGWGIHLYENGKLFLESLKQDKPDLIFLDLVMGKMTGFEVLEYLNTNNIKIPVIVISALTNKKYIIQAYQYGVKNYLTKPVNQNIIIEKAEEILNNRHILFEQIIGSADTLKKVGNL